MLIAIICVFVLHTLCTISFCKSDKQLQKKASSNYEELPLYKIFFASNLLKYNNGFYFIYGQYILIIGLPFFIDNVLLYLGVLYLNYRLSTIQFDVLANRAKFEAFEELQEFKGEKYFVKEISKE